MMFEDYIFKCLLTRKQVGMAWIYGIPDSQRELLNKYPRSVQKIKDIDIVYKDLKEQIKKEEGNGFFGRIKRWSKQRQINRFEENRDDPMHAGTHGEIIVLNELSKLSDDYHVLCGIYLELPRYVTYNGRKNLKSAQMDFVVVSKKGVVVIEVKNWSDRYYKQNKDFSPHEQVDRAGMVLWIVLKSWRSPQNPPVTKVLLPVRENMRYDSKFKYVLVKYPRSINSFIVNQEELFSEKEVKRIVDRLKNHVV